MTKINLMLVIVVAVSGWSLSASPQGREAHLKLYESALRAMEEQEYPLAESQLRQLLALDSRFQHTSGRSVYDLLGRVLELQDRKIEAIQVLKQGLDTLRANARNDWFLNYDLGRLYAELEFEGYDSTITALVYDVFKRSRPSRQPELWQSILDQMDFLFEPDQRERLREPTSEEGAKPGQMLMRFFRREDPSPITEQNEYLVTFFSRSAEARLRFGSDRLPSGFDARGELYVRYGKPYSILSDRSGIQGPIGYKVYPYEFWFYKHINKELYYTFIRPRGKSYFVLATGPESAFSTTYRGRSTFRGKERTTWSDRLRTDPTFGVEALSLRENLYLTLAGQHQKFRDRLNKLDELETSEAKLSYANSMFKRADHDHFTFRESIEPTVIYEVGNKRKDLPISISLNRFKGEDNRIRTEVYYSVPYRHLQFDEKIDGYHAQLRGQVAIFDEDYEMVAGDFIQERCVAPSARDTKQGLCINQWNYDLSPGQYDLFVSLEDTLGQRFEAINTSFEVTPFSTDSLALSDIQIASHIEETGELSQFFKKGYLVVPIPSLAVNKNQPVFVYFEIYNLTVDASGRTNYQIGYRISSGEQEGKGFLGIFGGKRRDESITLTDARTGTVTNQVEHIALDVQKLKSGEATLQVIVADLNAKKEVSSQVIIRLVD